MEVATAAVVVWSFLSHPLAPATLANFVLVVLAAAFVSWVIVYSGVNKPNRMKLLELSMSPNKALATLTGKLYDMTQCPFCAGTWVTGAIMLVFRFDFFGAGPLGVLLGIPAVAGVQAAVSLSLGLLVRKNPCDSCVTQGAATSDTGEVNVDEFEDEPPVMASA